jgi:hypothetical protein
VQHWTPLFVDSQKITFVTCSMRHYQNLQLALAEVTGTWDLEAAATDLGRAVLILHGDEKLQLWFCAKLVTGTRRQTAQRRNGTIDSITAIS